ncbi:hypothetical protein J2TS6_57550 [Paenibacillus albilobatus]|uniref:Uncharacterized protein n=1 Tax=Paenibacillus albilobatus TaxID=2716884 RepID=A0A920CF50_9BACL|nr:hypothetical protein J2TS6_57550 [Paenibacillus albilobatus]
MKFNSGASESGKTTIFPELLKQCAECITLDLDAIYGPLNEWAFIKNVWIHRGEIHERHK